MKRLLHSLPFLFFALFAKAQQTNKETHKFLDIGMRECEEKRARYYSIVLETDSGFYREDYFLPSKKLAMRGLFRDRGTLTRDGYFYFLYPTGNIMSYGQYVDGKKNGLWLSYYPDGAMEDSASFSNGLVKGIALHWYPNGYLSDSVNINRAANSVKVSWHDNGQPSASGRLDAFGRMTGKWQFFHSNGKLSSEELYEDGRQVSHVYYDENGTRMADTTDETRPAAYQDGITAWHQYINDHLWWPKGIRLVNYGLVTIGAEFTISETGEIKDIHLYCPFDPSFDYIVVDVLKHAPKWIPAMSHNRTTNYHWREVFSFFPGMKAIGRG
ncbi:MAG TPA: hypothetical protein VG842_05665 [Sediminibacterium sp.]|nr:hypothetical protein [Sediminibacterium sp.]